MCVCQTQIEMIAGLRAARPGPTRPACRAVACCGVKMINR